MPMKHPTSSRPKTMFCQWSTQPPRAPKQCSANEAPNLPAPQNNVLPMKHPTSSRPKTILCLMKQPAFSSFKTIPTKHPTTPRPKIILCQWSNTQPTCGPYAAPPSQWETHILLMHDTRSKDKHLIPVVESNWCTW